MKESEGEGNMGSQDQCEIEEGQFLIALEKENDSEEEDNEEVKEEKRKLIEYIMQLENQEFLEGKMDGNSPSMGEESLSINWDWKRTGSI